MTQVLSEVVVSGEQIEVICNKLEPILAEFERTHNIIALLSLATVLQKPEIDGDELRKIVLDTSRFMSMSLDDDMNPIDAEITPNKVN